MRTAVVAIWPAVGLFILVACGTSTPTTFQPLPGDLVNDCTYGVPEPKPDPSTPTPFPAAVPSRSTPEIHLPDVAGYSKLPPLALPVSVEAWADAVVRVAVELANGRVRDQQGLIVADNAVLTIADLTEEIASWTVDVSGRGTFAAELERFDSRTGAVLLTIEVGNLRVAPRDLANVSHGEPVLLLSRGQDGDELVVRETYASPSSNAPDDVFALRADYTRRTERGTVVVAVDGTLLGLAGHGRSWYGQQIVLGRVGGTDLPAVLIDSALRLLETVSWDAGITPAAVVYHGPGLNRHVDGPVTRGLLAEPLRATLGNLGEPVQLANLGRHPRYLLRPNSGTVLEVLYAEPQDLLGDNGELLGRARYIVLWWDREAGAPDLVLCGMDREHLGAAFSAQGLNSLEALMEAAPSSSPHSMVAARPLPRVSTVGNPENYQYPYVWDLQPDKLTYSSGEMVTLAFKITNISDWAVRLAYMPPRATIYSIQEDRDVAVLQHGDSHLILESREAASFSIEWDQVDMEGGRAEPGRYIVRVELANLVGNPLLDWGPQADLILK